MDVNFTLNELAEFAQQEQAMFEALNEECRQAQELVEEVHSPSLAVMNNIMGYSKALSIRDSKTLDKFEMILN